MLQNAREADDRRTRQGRRPWRAAARWLTAAVALVAVAAVAAVLAAPSLVPTRLAKAEIAERIGAWTGGPVTLGGEPVVTLFPAPAVAVDDVTVGAAGGADSPPVAVIPSLEASLKILPLLVGRVEVETLTLVEPRIRLVRDETGAANWGPDPARGEAALAAVFAGGPDPRPGTIVLRDAAIAYEDRVAGRRHEVTAADLTLVRHRPMRAAALSGSFVWRGTLVEVDAALDDPRAVLAGRGSDARLALAARRAPGGAEAAAAAPWRLAERLGIPIAPGTTFGPLHVEGTLEADAAAVRLSGATVELDGNAAEGGLAVGFGGDRPTVRGSLAFGHLDLAPYVDAVLPRSLAELLALPVSLRWLAHADVDLDASADEVDVGGPPITDAAARLVVRDGRMTLELDEAGLAGGRAAGRVTARPADDGAAVRLFGRLDAVSVTDAGEALWAALAHRLIGTGRPPQGSGSAAVELSAQGATVAAMVGSLDGWAVADIRDGSLDGADIVATLERLTEGNTVIAKGRAPFLPVAGRTHFTRLTARMAFGAGLARAEQVRIAGERFEITLAGHGDLARGEMEAQGTASLFTADADGGRSLHPVVELPFGIGGTVREPAVAPGIPRIAQHPGDTVALPPPAPRRLARGEEAR